MAEEVQIIIRAQNRAGEQINQVNDQLNQVGNTATVTTSRLSQLNARINNFGVRAAPATAGAASLNRAFTATNRSVTVLRQGIVVLGASAFPRLTGSILVASQGLQTFTDFARLSQFTLLGFAARAVPAIAGIAAVIATATAAWRAFSAAQEELRTGNNLLATQAANATRLIPMLLEARRRGRLTAEEFQRLTLNLAGSAANADSMTRALREAQAVVRDMQQSDIELLAREDLESLLSQAGEALLSEPEQQLAALNREMEEFISKAGHLAAAANLDVQPAIDLADQIRARRRAEINEAERQREQQAIQQQAQAESQRVGVELRGLQEVEDLRQRMRIATLTGTEREIAEINLRYDREIQRIQELVEELRLSGQAELDLINQINAARDRSLIDLPPADRGRDNPFDEFLTGLGDLDSRQRQVFGALNAEISGVARSITEAAFVTGNREGAFSNLGLTAINTLIEMGLQMVIQSTLASVLRKRSVAEAAVEGPTIAAAYTPAAATAGAATFGANAIGATIVVAAILASIAALSGAFKKGGFTGNGGKHDVAGVVHGGEFVFTKETVDRIGIRQLEMIQAAAQGGRSLPKLDSRLGIPTFQGGGPVPVPSPAGVSEINVGFMEDRQDLRRWQARRNFKQVAAEMARHGNRVNV